MSLTNQITIDLSDPAQVYRSVNKSFSNINDYLAETIVLEPRTNALLIKLQDSAMKLNPGLVNVEMNYNGARYSSTSDRFGNAMFDLNITNG